MILRILLLLLVVQLTQTKSKWEYPSDDVILHTTHLLKSAKRIIHDTDEQIERVQRLRLNSIRSIPFEVGYITFTIQEEYRRMVDKYNTCHTLGGRLFTREFMFYLEDVEYHFWKIEHLTNMMHEVERKYGMKADNTLDEDYSYFESLQPGFPGGPKRKDKHAGYLSDGSIWNTRSRKRRKKIKWTGKEDEFFARYKTTGTKRKSETLWPIEYGWEPESYFWW